MLALIIIPILTLTGFTSLFAKLTKSKISLAFPSVTAFFLIVLYFSTMLGILKYSTYLTYILGISCLIIYLLKEKNIKKIFKENIKEIGIFSLLCTAFAFYVKNGYFHAWDDFSHWGIFTKELLLNHIFESQSTLTSIIPTHAHYPRGASVYHYFMLLPSGYSEGGALFAHLLLHLAFLMPLFKNIRVWQSLTLVFSILMIVTLYTTGIRSIYNDSTIGIIFGSIFSVYILEDNKTHALYLILPILMLLPLFREIGFYLAIFASIILIINHSIYNKFPINLTRLLVYVSLLTLPIICNLVWVKYFKVTHNFFGRIEHSLANLLHIIDTFNDQHKLFITNYIKHFCKFLIKEGSLVIYTLLGISFYGVNKFNNKIFKEYRFQLISLLICFILFALWRLYLYFFTFTAEEAIKGASLLRYLGCYTLVFAIIACTYIKKTLFNNNLKNLEVAFFLGLLILSSITLVRNIQRIPNSLTAQEKFFDIQVERVSAYIKDGIEVKFNFNNKPAALNCFILNYKFAPYLKNFILKECLKSPVNYNIKNKILIENNEGIFKDEVTNKCRVLYSPFINNLEITCP